MATFIPTNAYSVPDAELLPVALHPLRTRVIAARDAWQAAAARQRAAELAAGSADAAFKASLSAAAHRGDDPSQVVDERQAKANAATRASQDTEACAQALTSAWWSFTEAVAAHATEIDNSHGGALTAAQAKTQRLVEQYLEARKELGVALSFAAWTANVSDAFAQGKRPPRFGPGAGVGSDVQWVSARGKHQAITAADLRDALAVDASAADGWREKRKQDAAIAARQAGDRAAQRAALPEGKLDLR